MRRAPGTRRGTGGTGIDARRVGVDGPTHPAEPQGESEGLAQPGHVAAGGERRRSVRGQSIACRTVLNHRRIVSCPSAQDRRPGDHPASGPTSGRRIGSSSTASGHRGLAFGWLTPPRRREDRVVERGLEPGAEDVARRSALGLGLGDQDRTPAAHASLIRWRSIACWTPRSRNSGRVAPPPNSARSPSITSRATPATAVRHGLAAMLPVELDSPVNRRS